MSPVRYTDTIGGGSNGGGPCPEDDFSIEIIVAETVPAVNDTASFAFGTEFADIVPAINDDLQLGLTFADIVPAINDTVNFGFNFTDTVPFIADDLVSLGVGFTETFSPPTDDFSLELLFADTIPVQTDAHSGLATWRVGATTASQTGNWQNPTNAQGFNDGSNATLTDGALNTNQGTLSLSAYADLLTDLGTWTITSIRLFSYHVVSNFVGLNNQLLIQYNVGAGFITLATITGNENFASTPRQFNLPLLSVAEINAMQVQFVYTAGIVSNTATINVDAVEFEVISTKASF